MWQEPGGWGLSLSSFFLLINFILFFSFSFLPCILIRIHLGLDILLVSLTVLISLIQCNTKDQLKSDLRHPTNLLFRMHCLRGTVCPDGNLCYSTIDTSCLMNLSLAPQGPGGYVGVLPSRSFAIFSKVLSYKSSLIAFIHLLVSLSPASHNLFPAVTETEAVMSANTPAESSCWGEAILKLQSKHPKSYKHLEEIRAMHPQSSNPEGLADELLAIIDAKINVVNNPELPLPSSIRSDNTKARIQRALDIIWKSVQVCKSVGDLAADIDPLHAGVAWIGVSIILQVSARLGDEFHKIMRR